MAECLVCRTRTARATLLARPLLATCDVHRALGTLRTHSCRPPHGACSERVPQRPGTTVATSWGAMHALVGCWASLVLV
eukprot:15099915-Alexandrium_andersonii.AAC.1